MEFLRSFLRSEGNQWLRREMLAIFLRQNAVCILRSNEVLQNIGQEILSSPFEVWQSTYKNGSRL